MNPHTFRIVLAYSISSIRENYSSKGWGLKYLSSDNMLLLQSIDSLPFYFPWHEFYGFCNMAIWIVAKKKIQIMLQISNFSSFLLKVDFFEFYFVTCLPKLETAFPHFFGSLVWPHEKVKPKNVECWSVHFLLAWIPLSLPCLTFPELGNFNDWRKPESHMLKFEDLWHWPWTVYERKMNLYSS